MFAAVKILERCCLLCGSGGGFQPRPYIRQANALGAVDSAFRRNDEGDPLSHVLPWKEEGLGWGRLSLS